MRNHDSNIIKVRNWRIVSAVLAILLGYAIVGNNDSRMEATEACGYHLKYSSALLASREE